MTPAAGAVALGLEVNVPPRLVQVDQPTPGMLNLVNSALLVPRANMSSLPAPVDAAPGSPTIRPPSDCHPDHLPPLNHLYHTALSVPRANTSRRPEPHEATAGPEVKPPPRLTHPDQPVDVT